jgi:PhoPQ-activated pathogenicity-related protein
MFYEHSKYDGNIAGINASDSLAIASDKTAFSSGSGPATFANLTSYAKGINGIFVDISGSHPNITADDFKFRVGNNNAPSSWADGPAPAAVTVLADGGGAGVDRVEIVWADGAIKRKWLEVIVAANVDTGLAASHVFFFGNALADSGKGNTATLANVDVTDELGARNHTEPLFNNIPLTNIYDYTRDGIVDVTDELLARNNKAGVANATRFLNLPAISPPALTADLANDTGPDGVPNSDGITTDTTIAGTLTAANSIVSFRAGLGSNPVTVDVSGLLQPGGSFTLSPAFLESMPGGPVADGTYTLHLEAVDSQSFTAAVHVLFTLDRSIATPGAPDLITADDTGFSSADNRTKINTPRIAVSAETGSLIRMYVDDVQVTQGTASPGFQLALPTVADGVHLVKAVSVDGAGNSAFSSTLSIIIDTVAPTLTVSTMVPFTDDVTPHVTVTGVGVIGTVSLDVDVNNDSDFADAGETSRTTTSLIGGSSYFQLSPALPLTDPIGGGAYVVQLRSRGVDLAGNEGISPLQSLEIDTIGSDALDNYIASAYDHSEDGDDPLDHYSVANTVVNADYTFYALDLTSQVIPGLGIDEWVREGWRSADDVNKPVWRHWVEVIVPTGAISSTALLLITGGNNTTGAPPDGSVPSTPDSNLLSIALATQSVAVKLRTVPSEPLTFTDEAFSRNEDEIIAYTFNKYMENLGLTDQTDNETWPLLLPMVQSAVSAMDAVQHFVGSIDDFVVTGYSKRGWTTWLTAAVDDRVKAIIPGVIDVLNMDEQMMHHHAFYSGVTSHTVDGFSDAIGDYVDYNIPEEVLTDQQRELGRIVDPYRYLNNGRFDDMPKLAINSSGDEFFVPDSSSLYFSDLPGTKNYLRYVPNTGHGLNSTATTTSTKSFLDAVINPTHALPQYTWTSQPGSITLQTTTAPVSGGVVMWLATNPTARDFRNEYTGLVWTSTTLNDLGGGTYVATASIPASGARAFFIQMTYPSELPGDPYIFTTDVQVRSNIPLGAWPFYMPPNPGSSPGFALSSDDESSPSGGALPSALVMTAGGGSPPSHDEPRAATASTAPSTAAANVDPQDEDNLTCDWPWAEDNGSTSDETTQGDADAVDQALAALGEDPFAWEA